MVDQQIKACGDFKFIYLFIFGCVGSSFLCEGFLQLRQAGATPHRGPPPLIAGPPPTAAAEHRLQTRRLSSRGPRAQLLRSTWDPPRPGVEPVSPALAGGLSTTAPPGKPTCGDFKSRKVDECEGMKRKSLGALEAKMKLKPVVVNRTHIQQPL